MTVWVDVVARSRGLSGRLLPDEQRAGLARSPDLPTLAARLAAHRGAPRPQAAPTPQAIELAERRRAATFIDLLGRWSAGRARHLAPLFEDEDCRSLRAAVRGALAGVPPDERGAGLIPTPSLPVRSLGQLVATEDVAAVGALLAAWGNPYAPAVLDQAVRAQPDLFTIEHALSRTWAARSRRAARRAGRAMRRYVERRVDLANLWTARILHEQGYDGDACPLFIDGGRLVPRQAFAQAVASRNALLVLDPLVRRTPLAAATHTTPGSESAVSEALRCEQRDLARVDPLGTAPILDYWLRLRREVEAVQRAGWGLAAGAPPAFREVTA